jgi:hypothetical protein
LYPFAEQRPSATCLTVDTTEISLGFKTDFYLLYALFRMADCSTVLEKGIQLMQQAVSCDHNQNYKEALNFYTVGLEAFISVLKCTKKSHGRERRKQRNYCNLSL